MDEFDWSPIEEAETTHIDLRRRVCLSGRSYDVSVCGGGNAPVEVRLTGRNAGGYIVTDLSGEVLVHDLVDVADLFQATLEGVAAASRHDETWQSRANLDLAEWQRSVLHPAENLPPNWGAKWTDEDLTRLVERHRAGATVKELMAEFGRTDGGIRSRLQMLGESLSTHPEHAGQAGHAGQAEHAGRMDGADSDDRDAARTMPDAMTVGGRTGAAEGAGPIDDRAERDRFIFEADVDDVGDRQLHMESVT